jgi:hypothetical protein
MSVMKSSDNLKDKSFAKLTKLWDDLDLGIDLLGNPVPVRNPPTVAELFLDDLLRTPQQRLAKLHQERVDAAFERWVDAADIHALANCHLAVSQGGFDKESWLADNPLKHHSSKHRREAAPIPLKDDHNETQTPLPDADT